MNYHEWAIMGRVEFSLSPEQEVSKMNDDYDKTHPSSLVFIKISPLILILVENLWNNRDNVLKIVFFSHFQF